MNTRDIIITIVLLIICVVLGSYLTYKINEPIEKQEEIDKQEADIIDKLKLIRKLQIAYSSVHGTYAGSWKELSDFAKNGKLVIINKKEENSLDEQGVESVKIKIDTLGTIPVKDSLFKGEYENFKPSEIAIIPHSKNKKFSLYAARKMQGDIMVNFLEVKDIYPKNPERGAQLNDKGEPWSVPTLKKHYNKRLKKKTEEAVEIQKKQKAASKAEQRELQIKLDEVSKYINLYQNRIEQLDTKPLQIGSREEATTAGNWKKAKDL